MTARFQTRGGRCVTTGYSTALSQCLILRTDPPWRLDVMERKTPSDVSSSAAVNPRPSSAPHIPMSPMAVVGDEAKQAPPEAISPDIPERWHKHLFLLPE